MTTTLDGHIVVDDSGMARVAGSRIKVIHLVMDKVTNNLSPEQLQENFPHLSLATVYAALVYYHDHRAECDAQIAESIRYAEEMRALTPDLPFVKKWREEGRI